MASQSLGAKGLLVSAAVGSATPTDDWSIHVSKMPPTPDKAIAIFDTGGTGEGPSPKWLLDYRTMQVRVRSNADDYTGAYNKMQDVKDVLLGLPAQAVLGDRWDGVTILSDITFIGRDDNDRPELSINFRLIIEPATNALTHREVL
jgi:hypothetical protein